jgi:hypothetical protein
MTTDFRPGEDGSIWVVKMSANASGKTDGLSDYNVRFWALAFRNRTQPLGPRRSQSIAISYIARCGEWQQTCSSFFLLEG